MTEWTDEALDQYAKRALLDALRHEWDEAGQRDSFTPSKAYQASMRELAANPEAWYRRKTEAPWRRYARRLSLLAALAAIVFVAVQYLPAAGGKAAAQMPPVGVLPAMLLVLAAAVVFFAVNRKKK